MGFFGLSDAGNMGFASVKNTQNFTDAQLFEKLSAVKVSFGTAQMGDIKGTPAVMYKNATPEFDIFARVHKGNVIMGKIGADGARTKTRPPRTGTWTSFCPSSRSLRPERK